MNGSLVEERGAIHWDEGQIEELLSAQVCVHQVVEKRGVLSIVKMPIGLMQI
jgi:hypothetical protein